MAKQPTKPARNAGQQNTQQSEPTQAKKGPLADVLINWKPTRALVIHAAHSGSLISKLSAANATLTREQVKEMLAQNKPLHIIPGIHKVPALTWAIFKDHETILDLLANEELVVITKAMVSKDAKNAEDADAPATNLPESLEELGANEAQDLVDGLVTDENVALLEKWQATEKEGKKRRAVLEALEKRINTIKETAERFAGKKS